MVEKTWRVRYVDLIDRGCHLPFYKRTAYVSAATRQEAIAKVRSRFAPPRYGEYRASVCDQAAAWF